MNYPLSRVKRLGIILGLLTIVGCGTLDKKLLRISAGDTKQTVVNVLGAPYDRQLTYGQEAWQYCVSGAGFGYNDHKILWFINGKVSGITTYRSSRTGCNGVVRTIRWEDAPDSTLELRIR